jgi:tripartite ATP-independent transporter DctP family solute receptor
MKRILALVLTTALVISTLAACGQSNQPATTPATTDPAGTEQTAEPANLPSYTLKYAELNPDGHIMAECGNYFANLVKEKSEGRITIEVFPAAQLGDEKTMYQSIQMGGGAIDIGRGNTNALGDFGINKLTLFGLPFIFRDREHLWSVLNSPIGAEFLREPQEAGSSMVGLFYMDEGSRHFFTTKDITIDSLASFKGLKLRVPTTDLMSDTANALGVQSTPISFSELYSALQTGTVQGAEQPFAGYYSNKFYEVAPNLALTGHTYSPSIVLMSESVWNNLDVDAQNIIMEAAKETEIYNKQSIEELDNQLKTDIAAAGANIIEIPDKTPFIDATKDVVAKYAAGYEDYYNQIINM